MRIAMWSGPRNLSTAMMYAFGARGDCAVWDEPFYAAYLRTTGIDHPMSHQIMTAHETDPKRIAQGISGSIPGRKPNFYLKVMPHHMVEGFPMDWANDCVNVHLIRHPARVIASYGAKRETVVLEDLGFRQQAELYDRIGGVVIDSAEIRDNPDGMLRKLCDAIGLPYDPRMLSWPEGGHRDDGIWASHWYGAVHGSSGFAGPEGVLPKLTGDYAALATAALPYYQTLAAHRLRPVASKMP